MKIYIDKKKTAEAVKKTINYALNPFKKENNINIPIINNTGVIVYISLITTIFYHKNIKISIH